MAESTDANDARAPAAGRLRRWEVAALAGILAAGALVRGLYLGEIARRPDFRHPAVDAGFHDYWARALTTGRWTPPDGLPDPNVRGTPFLRPPGYPYALAGVYAVTGGGALAPRVLQMLLGLSSAVLAMAIARRWAGRAAGLLAAAGTAGYWSLVYFEGELHAVALLIPLLLTATLLLGLWAARGRWVELAAASAALGLAALLRPNALALPAVAAVWAGVLVWRRGARRRLPAAALAALAPAAAVVLPVTVRNALVAGDVVLISSNAGVNLYIGNCRTADGTCLSELPGLGRFGTCFDYARIVRRVERTAGRAMSHSEVSAWLAGRALAHARRHPARTARLLLTKAALLAGPRRVGHNKEVHYERANSRVLRWLPAGFPGLLGLAAAGLGLSWHRRGRRAVLLLTALMAAVLLLSVLPFFVAERYRAPAVPLLVILAACVPPELHRRLRGGRRAAAAGWVALAAGLWAGLHLVPGDYRPSEAKWHHDLGFAHLRSGAPAGAEAHLRRAVQLEPGFALAHYNLGVALSRLGRPDAAAGRFREAIRLAPSLPGPYNHLGMATLRAGKLDEAIALFRRAADLAPDDPEVLSNLGLALSNAGRHAEAERHLARAIRLRRSRAESHNNLGVVMMRLGAFDRAAGCFRAALRRRADYVQALDNLGAALAALGRTGEAVEAWRRALALDASDFDARNNLGSVLVDLGRADEALAHLAAARRLRPGSAPAALNHARALQAAGRPAEAVGAYRAALRLREDFVPALNGLAWLRATHPEASVRDGAEAAALALRACELTGRGSFVCLDTLAAALAESGRFDEAAGVAERAAALAGAAGRPARAEDIRRRLALYRASRPFRAPRPRGRAAGEEGGTSTRPGGSMSRPHTR